MDSSNPGGADVYFIDSNLVQKQHGCPKLNIRHERYVAMTRTSRLLLIASIRHV